MAEKGSSPELIAKLENYQKMKVEKKYSLIQEFRTKKDFGNPQVIILNIYHFCRIGRLYFS
jgi:hypothetical protein